MHQWHRLRAQFHHAEWGKQNVSQEYNPKEEILLHHIYLVAPFILHAQSLGVLP